MRCPSCGIIYRDSLKECAECGPRSSLPDSVVADESRPSGRQRGKASKAKRAVTPALEQKTRSNRQNSRLIEFPGTSRNSVPQWRKELSVRVREVLEKRAREAATELAEAERQRKHDPRKTPPLELIAHRESTPVNPLVAAALRRIERAHLSETPAITETANTAVAVAYAGGNGFQEEVEITVERLVPMEPVASPFAFLEEAELQVEHPLPMELVPSPFAFLEEAELQSAELQVEHAVPMEPDASPFAFLEEAELVVEHAVPMEPLASSAF